jgi:dihydrolipoamide dehydrogenase
VGLVQHAEDYGIAFDNVRYDYGKAIDRSRQVVDRLTTGVAFLLKKNNVSYVEGHGRLKDPNAVEVRSSGRTLTTENVIIATGARFRDLPNLPVDGKVVITSREALALREVPERIVIVGGGATGVEFAYVYSKYGAEVTIVELLPNLVPLEDRDVSVQLERSFRRGGIKSMTGSRVESVEVGANSALVTVSNDGGESVIECDKVLVAVGTQGNIEEIGLEDAGVATERGFIPVDDQMSTNVPGVYAIGDVTGKMLLAHVASAQGVMAAETMAGVESQALDYVNMPRATYCLPQVASFGLTEQQARDQGHSVRIGKFPFQASGKAVAIGETVGMVKLVVDDKYGEILGAHMIGPEVTEMLAELSMARLLEGTTTELGWMVHSHPTLSEVVKEAALGADGQAIHI